MNYFVTGSRSTESHVESIRRDLQSLKYLLLIFLAAPLLGQQSVTVIFNYDFTGHSSCTGVLTTSCFDRFEAGVLTGSVLNTMTSIPPSTATGSVSGFSGIFAVGVPGPTQVAVVAVARDASGNRLTSDPLQCATQVTIADTTPPVVSFASPSSGSIISGTTVVQAVATDNVGLASTSIFLDGMQISSSGTATWDSTKVAGGSHILTAKATDAAGNTGSASVTVTVSNVAADTTVPAVTFVSPVNGANVAGITSIQIDSSDNVGVQSVALLVDGSQIATGSSIQWNTLLVANAGHTLTAKATDAAGNVGIATVTVTVNNTDTIPPSIAITWPTNGMSIPRGDLTLTCAAIDNTVVSGVQWQVDGVNVGSDLTSAPYSLNWNSSTMSGKGWHSLTAVARDSSGLSTVSSSVRFRVQ